MATRTRPRRQTSLGASMKIQEQLRDDDDAEQQPRPAAKRAARGGAKGASGRRGVASLPAHDGNEEEEEEYRDPKDEDSDIGPPSAKRRKTAPSRPRSKVTKAEWERRFAPLADADTSGATCDPRTRLHSPSYHRPLLLDGELGRQQRAALLAWFDAVGGRRGMPWRKPFIDPADYTDPDPAVQAALATALGRRAYEVWISEVMLQQTRVAVVVDYWERWMKRWALVDGLAAASVDDVLAQWRGLGYYSRARRIHETARRAAREMGGLLPAEVAELEKLPGVGRYTAGAISAIVFGRAAPMVDGNVLRVLSRQMGVLGDVKKDRGVIDLLWAAADALATRVAWDEADGREKPALRYGEHGTPISDRPGRWGQGLMELGSTVCTPKPNCAECPITATCRAYQEGYRSAVGKGNAAQGAADIDIEELCDMCEPPEAAEADEDAAPLSGGAEPKAVSRTRGTAAPKQATVSSYFGLAGGDGADGETDSLASSKMPTARQLEKIVDHARRFPLKVLKGAVRQQETLVCAIRRSNGDYLIQRRPDKGLLAGLWEFPSRVLPDGDSCTAATRLRLARDFVSALLGDAAKPRRKNSRSARIKYQGELGSVPWLFSHLKLTMHAHAFSLSDDDEVDGMPAPDPGQPMRWASAESVEGETMGTGMRRCWALVKEVAS